MYEQIHEYKMLLMKDLHTFEPSEDLCMGSIHKLNVTSIVWAPDAGVGTLLKIIGRGVWPAY